VAATLPPYLTYKWFDPADKEIEERGVLQFVKSDGLIPCGPNETSWGADDSDVAVTVTLANIGKRPMKDTMISVAHSHKPVDLEVEIEGFTVQLVGNSEHTSVFSISPAIPPGANISLHARGKFSSIAVNPQTRDPILNVFDL